mmetsp:Transcript_55041/g.87850  ORF Transcript_55041/g.87850 Transcript_55041/m.87850 type:complete len:425 (+) Transcript_55041:96-1370(+)
MAALMPVVDVEEEHLSLVEANEQEIEMETQNEVANDELSDLDAENEENLALEEEKRDDRVCCCSSRCYIICNIVRLLVIAILIYLASNQFETHDEALQSDCCNCYQLAKNTTQPHARFDLSMCIPSCADCNYCEHQIGAVHSDISCPATNYTVPTQTRHTDWYQQTGCAPYKSQLSLTEFRIMLKTYGTFRVLSLCTIVVYICLLIALLLCGLCGGCCSERESSRTVLFYNVIYSPVCLYFLLKPYEYHPAQFTVFDHSVTCSQVAISVDTHRAIIVMMVGVLVFAVLYVLYVLMVLCVAWRSRPGAQSPAHVTEEENNLITEDQEAESVHSRWNCCKFWIGVLFGGWILVTFVILVISFVEIKKYDDRRGDTYSMPGGLRWMLWVSAVLSILLLFDFLSVGTARNLLREYCAEAARQCACICR